MTIVRLNDSEHAPDFQQVESLLSKTPDALNLIEWSEYEENIEFKITLTYGGDELHIEGYTGLWELISYDGLTTKGKEDVIDTLLEWLTWEYEDEDCIDNLNTYGVNPN